MTNRLPLAERPTVSVVICAYTEKRWLHLTAAVASCLMQSHRATEVLVVVDHNPDLLARVRQELPGVRAIASHYAQGLSGARNTGYETATADVIAYIDDDAEADIAWLESLMRHYARQDVIGVGGTIAPAWETGRPPWFPREFDWIVGCTYDGLPTEAAEVRNVIGANMSIRRELLVALQGFRGDLGRTQHAANAVANVLGNEETEFCIRATKTFPEMTWIYEPRAVVRHFVPYDRATLAYFVRRSMGEGVSKARLGRFVGMKRASTTERYYVQRVLPRAALRGLRESLEQRDLSGVMRSAAIAVGLGATVVGYVREHIALRGGSLRGKLMSDRRAD